MNNLEYLTFNLNVIFVNWLQNKLDKSDQEMYDFYKDLTKEEKDVYKKQYNEHLSKIFTELNENVAQLIERNKK